MIKHIRATQLFDCADVAKTLVAEGRRQGERWKQVEGPWMRGNTKGAYYRFRMEQAAAYPFTQVWHVNMGGRAKWARGAFSRPYALTLHGTDIRQSYWEKSTHKAIKSDIDLAGQVWYTTPDLRLKAMEARPDAEYLPVPINVDELPKWTPAVQPKVFFASRWDNSKGGDSWLQAAADVSAALKHQGIDVVGLGWGERAGEAAEHGVRLIPKMAKADFLKELSSAHVVVGQMTGALGASELQAIGIGVPTIFADPVDGYPNDMAAVCVERGEVAQAVKESLADPFALSGRLKGHDYIFKNHAPSVLLPMLRAGYAKALAAAS